MHLMNWPIRSNPPMVGMKAYPLWPEPTKPRALAQWSLAMKTMEKARPGARGHGAPALGGKGHCHQIFCAHSRNQFEKAGHACVNVSKQSGLQHHPRRR